MRRIAAFIILLTAVPKLGLAAEPTPGPINARVVSVYDGDTLTVDAEPWPGVTIRTAVRVSGVDTPEIRGKCQAEKDLAIRARDFVREKVGEQVQIANVKHGKYAGRVVADVLVAGERLGRPYEGGPRESWCQ